MRPCRLAPPWMPPRRNAWRLCGSPVASGRYLHGRPGSRRRSRGDILQFFDRSKVNSFGFREFRVRRVEHTVVNQGRRLATQRSTPVSAGCRGSASQSHSACQFIITPANLGRYRCNLPSANAKEVLDQLAGWRFSASARPRLPRRVRRSLFNQQGVATCQHGLVTAKLCVLAISLRHPPDPA